MKRTKHTKHSIYAPKNSGKTKCIHHKIRLDRQFYREIAKSVCGCMLSSFDLVLLLYEFFSIFRGEYDILSPDISFSFNHLLILIILNFNETDSLGMRIGLFLFFFLIFKCILNYHDGILSFIGSIASVFHKTC